MDERPAIAEGREGPKRKSRDRVPVIQPRLLSLSNAALYLDCSPKYLYHRTTSKGKERLPFAVIRRGGRCYFDRLQLDAYVDKLVREQGEGFSHER